MSQEINSVDPFPESLELAEDDSILEIAWDDGQITRLRLDALRAACSCAVCQGHHPSQSLNLTPEQFPGIRITDIAPVGRYAYHIVWSDGHDTGIYTLKMLRELSGAA
jgi:DUF971 family protein